jgi:hypothetical protein
MLITRPRRCGGQVSATSIDPSDHSPFIAKDPIDDHRPLQVEVFHEVPPLLPVDEGPRFPQSGNAFADLGSDGAATDLCGKFQT